MTNTRAGPRSVFVDTSGFVATINRRDGSHVSAISIVRRLAAQRWQLYTSNFIVAETHAMLLSRLGRREALAFLNEMETGGTLVERVGEDDERRALTIIRQYDDKNFSFTDATCFAISERLELRDAFTFDRNFAQFGLNVLQP